MRTFPDAQRARNGRGNQTRIPKSVPEISHPDAIGNLWTTSAAKRRANRVLPTPPGPVSVNRREPASNSGSVFELSLPSDEAGEVRRQVVTMPIGGDAFAADGAAECWELSPGPFDVRYETIAFSGDRFDEARFPAPVAEGLPDLRMAV